jgi:hypothetical protein
MLCGPPEAMSQHFVCTKLNPPARSRAFLQKKIAKNTQPPISVAASHFPHFYSWNHLGVL